MKFKILTISFAFALLNVAQAASSLLANEDLTAIPYIHPTTYYITDEAKYHCPDADLVTIYKSNGIFLAKVCKKFFKSLVMEGTGRLKDRGEGPVTVNWLSHQKVKILSQCIYGEGAGAADSNSSNCLLPFYTVAADLRAGGYKRGDIVYIPKADGIILPDGSVHNGIFEVRDTGGAFKETQKQRLDLFIGLQNDRENVFARAGFKTAAPWDDYEAFLVTGDSKIAAKNFLREKFKGLY